MKKQGFAKIRAELKGKGFIVALAVSIAAVGLSTYYAYNSIMNGFKEGEGSDSLFLEVDKHQPNVPLGTSAPITTPAATAASEAPGTVTGEITAEPAATAANNFFSTGSPRALPLQGEIINGYSDGELVKSETLNLWQTHDGIDIAAEAGAEIAAAGEGTVLNVWEDPLWGICISVDHGDGYVSNYLGVDKNVPVLIGQEVACGDVIARVGNTAECECALPSHLHFEVKKDGEFIDPVKFTESN